MDDLGHAYPTVFAYGFGVFLAGAIAYAAHRMPSGERRYLTSLMAIVVGGFVGFPLAAGDLRGAIGEAAVVVVLGPLLAWSWHRTAPTLLAVVYFAHGAADVAHLLGGISGASPSWIHEVCIPFDWLMAAYVLTRRTRWLADPAA